MVWRCAGGGGHSLSGFKAVLFLRASPPLVGRYQDCHDGRIASYIGRNFRLPSSSAMKEKAKDTSIRLTIVGYMQTSKCFQV